MSSITPFSSLEGQKLLANALDFNSSYFTAISECFEAQATTMTCGVCTLTILMNALFKAEDRAYLDKDSELKRYTQEVMIEKIIGKTSSQILTIDDFNGEKVPGISLNMAKKTLKAMDCKVQLERLSIELQETSFLKDQLLENLGGGSYKNRFLAVNFDGRKLGLPYSGHFSPIAAYSQRDDQLLVMDVNAHTSSWFWTSPLDLQKAMTGDGKTSFHRGFFWVSRKAAS